MKAIKITTNNRISVIDIDVNDFRAINREIGCSIHEVVKTKTMMDWFTVPVVMLVDEEGLLRRRRFNSVASYMYGGTVPRSTDCWRCNFLSTRRRISCRIWKCGSN